MPVHDWELVVAEIFHALHPQWVSEIKRAFNQGLLPSDYYATVERAACGMKSLVAVRHVSGDRVVAMIEVMSPGNKKTTSAFRSFVQKASELLEQRVHLLLLNPFPPGPRDPNGIHAVIWDDVAGQGFDLPPEKPLTLVAYEADYFDTQAYIETISVGDPLPNMPLFLAPQCHILVPLEATYRAAWYTVPLWWRRVIEPVSAGEVGA